MAGFFFGAPRLSFWQYWVIILGFSVYWCWTGVVLPVTQRTELEVVVAERPHGWIERLQASQWPLRLPPRSWSSPPPVPSSYGGTVGNTNVAELTSSSLPALSSRLSQWTLTYKMVSIQGSLLSGGTVRGLRLEGDNFVECLEEMDQMFRPND